MTLLTKENAPYVSSIRNVDFPEWGTKRFNYQDCIGADGEKLHSFGTGCNSAMLAEHEFHFWEIVSFKQVKQEGVRK